MAEGVYQNRKMAGQAVAIDRRRMQEVQGARRLRRKRRKQIRFLWATIRLMALVALLLCTAHLALPLLQDTFPQQGQGGLGQGNTDVEPDYVLPQEGVAMGTSGVEDLVLVNPWNAVPEGYEVDLVELSNGQAVDAQCYEPLQRMLDDCRAAGLSPLICSSYRPQEKQEQLFSNKTQEWVAQGYSWEAAEEKAATSVAYPGTSEHQLGLAVDIVDEGHQILDESQEDTPVQRWLLEHCWEYGFILRYPTGKSEVTGIIYEPWHYRFVGTELALELKELGVCLEEYLQGAAY